jgi:hypothetical protein
LRSSRVPALIASATIALGALTGTAAAKPSHWSQTKCIKTYNAWYKKYAKHIDPKKGPTAKQNKQLNAYIRMIEKQHGCILGG